MSRSVLQTIGKCQYLPWFCNGPADHTQTLVQVPIGVRARCHSCLSQSVTASRNSRSEAAIAASVGVQLGVQQLDVTSIAEHTAAQALRQLGHDTDVGQAAERFV